MSTIINFIHSDPNTLFLHLTTWFIGPANSSENTIDGISVVSDTPLPSYPKTLQPTTLNQMS